MRGTFNGWITHPKGGRYGFITPADLPADLPEAERKAANIHIVERGLLDPDTLYKGCQVEFETVTTARGLQARDVRLVAPPARAAVAPALVGATGEVRFYNEVRHFGMIRTPASPDRDVYVPERLATLPGTGLLRDGDQVRFDAIQGAKGLEAIRVERLGWQHSANDPESFFDVFELPNLNWKVELQALAEPEPWDYRSSSADVALPVLANYIDHTFRRLRDTHGLVVDTSGTRLSFNTGLVTPNEQEIYAVAYQSKVEGHRPWTLRGFFQRSDREFYPFVASPPPLARYFDDPARLLFYPEKHLNLDIDHILRRIDRFPEELRNDPVRARHQLEMAETAIKRRAQRNYKVAVPQFFRERGGPGELQLLLPLCLITPGRTDLALTAAYDEEHGFYRCSTVLTLDQAYNNARLLARPDREWLDPELPSSTEKAAA